MKGLFTMGKKILALALSLSLAAFCFTGCTDSDDDSASTTTSSSQTESSAEADDADSEEETESDTDELKAPVSDTAIDVSEGATENMLTRSILYEGDTSRLAEKIQAALDNAADDSLTTEEKTANATKIAFLGDSITAGSQATSSSNTYTKQYQTWWEENISYYVEGINAGIGATDSYLAVHRVDTEVLAEEPDIIFIEFINDTDTEFYKTTMDSLIRKCLAAPNNPAVILVEMTMEDGTCPQNVHSEIGEYYDIPIISYHDAVLPEVEAGNIAWTDISPDNIHPNDEGHIMLGQLLSNFTQIVMDNLDSIETTSTAFDTSLESPTGDKYANATLCDNTSELVTVTEGDFSEQTSAWNFQDGWRSSTGGTITFEMEFQNLGILYYKTTDGKSGTATITIDGVEVADVNADFTDGWGDYACNEELVSLDESGTHTVTVSVPEGENFEILRWMIS
ncbi:MAG: SGNH/GDSL hydrolase family protein [Ruminococcus sp.]|nr:SGNH/GDSL hydrolase family protein [Ruminococcus sp.]